MPLGQLRWNPLPIPEAPVTFIDGIRTMTTAGDVQGQSGMAAHVYVANASMVDEHFFNADGELLIVPEAGSLRVAYRNGRHGSGAIGNLRHPAWHGVPR